MREYKILEFDRIQNMLQELAESELGKQLASSLAPAFQFAEVARLQQETTEALSHLIRTGFAPVADFPDIRVSLARGKVQSILSPKELLQTARCLKVTREARSALAEGEGIIYNMGRSLIIYRDIEENIQNSILSEEEIADSASAELSAIRRKIRRANERIRERLNSMIHSQSYQKYLQEPIITIRNERFVVPVKQEYRQYVPGMLHDQSSSGATLFIEPMAVVEINNELKSLFAEEKEEIERILYALTAQISPVTDDIIENMRTLSQLDLIFAKARLSRQMKASEPELNCEGEILIRKACHPLIDRGRVVPVDIEICRERQGLLITGPNTGGKTVTLKTIGLLTMMAQSGLHIPAQPGAKICVYEHIFADIGDEQSIEQSLSTFSAHMKNIVNILDGVTERSLVLLDELGSGTDPTEGAALAMAILDDLIAAGATIAATTHYSELKEYALIRPEIENACMEFDVNTLQPTYRLFLGIPGRSNAFEISSRLGLREGIVEKARKYVSMDDLRVEEAIRSAEEQRIRAEKDRLAAEEAMSASLKMEQEIQQLQSQAEQQRKQLLEKSREEARETVIRAKREAEEILEEMKRLSKQSGSREKMTELRRSLEKQEERYSSRIERAVDDSEPPKTVKKGDAVRILSIDNEGVVLNSPDAKGDVQVQIGAMKMIANLKDLRLRKGKIRQIEKKKNYDFKAQTVSAELDVRMNMVEEALLEIDRYLDQAFRAGLTEVRIIHGKGTGTLRAAVQQHLKNQPHIKSYRLGHYGEGETGVTVVELK